MLAEGFKYRGLIEYFERVSAIPRPSFHEERIAEYICNFARERGYFCLCDDHNNVFVRMPASEGRESEDAILLQGHTDMVCEKNADVEHDFMTEGIELYEREGYIRARGTTLGADNGTAVAMMLYILDGAEGYLKSHPTIECLFTSSEEKGLVGAGAFDYSVVSATRMINMDSADESEIIIGCAGAQHSELILDATVEEIEENAFKVGVRGLYGGHSGEDIHKSRANANKLLGRVLEAIRNACNIRLSSAFGGNKDNAIPRESAAVIVCDDPNALKELLNKLSVKIGGEMSEDDRSLELYCESLPLEKRTVFSKKDSDNIISFLASVPNGVFKMCDGLDSLVEFSRNLGIVEADAKNAKAMFAFMSRSPKESQIEESNAELSVYAERYGMRHERLNSYSGWDGSPDSPLCKLYASCYKELFGKECTVNVLHAGLECGIIKHLCPQLDIISSGAIVLDLHSPDEALNIASFERFFSVIILVLTNC